MLSLLNWIICLVTEMFYYVQDGIMWAANEVILGLAAALAALIILMPNMPTLTPLPTGCAGSFTLSTACAYTTGAGWASWLWPVSTTVDIFAFFVTAWLVWLGVSIGLRWAKAINN